MTVSDSVYVITTPTSEDRLRRLRSHLGDAPVSLREIRQAQPRLTLPWRVRKSYFDQYKKYLDVFEQIAQSERPALVLEDDALALPGWWEALQMPIPAIADFDFLFISDDFIDHPKTPVAEDWLKCHWSRTTCATVYSPRAARLLLRRKYWCHCAMDWTINYLLQKRPDLNCYWHRTGLFQHGSMHGEFPSLCED